MHNCICVQGRRTGCITVYVFREEDRMYNGIEYMCSGYRGQDLNCICVQGRRTGC